MSFGKKFVVPTLNKHKKVLQKRKLTKDQAFSSREAPPSQALVIEVVEVEGSNPEPLTHDMVVSSQKRKSLVKDIPSPTKRKTRVNLNNASSMSAEGTIGKITEKMSEAVKACSEVIGIKC